MSDSDSDVPTGNKPSSGKFADSKLRSSIESFGTNSYYYAHSKSTEFVVPSHAKVVEGPGIITGGQPVKIAEGGASPPSTVRRRIEKYSWSDDDHKVTLYIDDSVILPHIADNADGVKCDFGKRSMRLEVHPQDGSCYLWALDIPELHEEINVNASNFRVSSGKRITVSLHKNKPSSKWHSLKK